MPNQTQTTQQIPFPGHLKIMVADAVNGPLFGSAGNRAFKLITSISNDPNSLQHIILGNTSLIGGTKLQIQTKNKLFCGIKKVNGKWVPEQCGKIPQEIKTIDTYHNFTIYFIEDLILDIGNCQYSRNDADTQISSYKGKCLILWDDVTRVSQASFSSRSPMYRGLGSLNAANSFCLYDIVVDIFIDLINNFSIANAKITPTDKTSNDFNRVYSFINLQFTINEPPIVQNDPHTYNSTNETISITGDIITTPNGFR